MFAYPATNTLVITDSGTNIDRLMKIIKELDQEGPQQVLEIIPINYASASEVAQTVLNLFEIQQKTATATTARRAPARGAAAPTGEEMQDVSKIIADERTNSLIVLASRRAIPKVREVIAKLDVPLDLRDTGNIHVHYLKYANAKELAETLASITSGAKAVAAKAGAKGAEGAGSSVASLGEGVAIGADETTNALIITASSADYKVLVEELISKLDVPRRQVYLESVVMELEVTNTSKYGATGYGGYGGGNMIGFGGSTSSDFNPAQFFTPGGLFNSPGMLGGLLSRDTITIDIPNTSGGGTQQMTIPAFAAFLNFLATNSQANIVSTPNIMTLDNQKAMIDVSKTIYAKKVTQSGTTGFQSVEPTPLEAGLTLEITPQITEGDAVRLEIHHKLSNFTGPVSADTGAADTTKREIQTTVVAMDGQTVVLGGLMQDIDTVGKSKIPILGDIPVLGLLFSYNTKLYNKTNMLVFITPYVIKDPTDFAEITKRKIEQRNAFLDKNYSRRRQRDIKDTISRHRADLLEFVDPISAPMLSPVPIPMTSSATEATIVSPAYRASSPASGVPPIITAAPVGPGGGAPASIYSGSSPIQPVRPAPQSPSVAPGTPKIDESKQPDMAY
jgi:general secretion pathway protein D